MDIHAFLRFLISIAFGVIFLTKNNPKTARKKSYSQPLKTGKTGRFLRKIADGCKTHELEELIETYPEFT